MDPRSAATGTPDPDAVEFVRFCYRRRRVGWPELYDEMCAVAARGLFRGLDTDDLSTHGVGFGLFEMPALAALVRRVVAEEQALRRPVAVMIRPDPEPVASADPAVHVGVSSDDEAGRDIAPSAGHESPERTFDVPIRLAMGATPA
jgi:hypothetical protein